MKRQENAKHTGHSAHRVNAESASIKCAVCIGWKAEESLANIVRRDARHDEEKLAVTAELSPHFVYWIPACAGMTAVRIPVPDAAGMIVLKVREQGV